MPETAKRTARVPILGEDGRISDDYIPAAIGEGVESAEAAAKRAETAATNADGSATAASQSAAGAQGSASAAKESATQAQQSATAASGAATSAQSAKTAAEAAKAAAETAQSAAAGSAQDAQQSATAASESAASVADKFISSAQATTLDPGSQATASVENQVLTIGVPKGEKGDKGDQGEKGDPGTGVPDGGTSGQLLSKTETGTAWVDPPSTGNVLTGEAEGYVAHAEDAYAQKPIEVRVKGKTWVNRWPVINQSLNGITISTDDTGLITVSGTASTTSVYVSTPIDGIAANKNYALLISSNVRSDVSIMVQTVSGDSFTELVSNADGISDTGTTPASFDSVVAAIQVSSGTTVNTSFRVMLVDGTEAPDCFTPCASITSVEAGNLVTAGKNLLDISAWTKVGTSGQLTVQPDGSWKCDGYDNYATSGFVSPILPPGSYHADVSNFTDGAQVGLACSVAQSGFSRNTIWSNYGCEYLAPGIAIHTFVSSVPFRIGIVINSAKYGGELQPTIYVYDPQLELGSTATSYEPPTVTETPLPEVELRSLPNGTCDELVIRADGTCEVERRTGYIASYTDEEVTGEYVSTGNGLEAGASIVYELDEPTAEPQSHVALPALPAPTFNQYHDSPVPSDTSVEYERDINIAFSELQAQISATTVREATNG